jgi:branched-chain amino acid transport system permease protein
MSEQPVSEAPEAEAILEEELREMPIARERRAGPTLAGWIARRTVLLAILAGIVIAPLFVSVAEAGWISTALIYIVVGLSVNILMGYAGQISLGHQAFVGVGAFTSALMVSKYDQTFWIGLVVAALTGAISALILGFVALRLKGLYLALITLAYGTVAEFSIFTISAVTGGGAGADAPRPAGFSGEKAYVYLCMAVVAVLMYVDWRLVKSKVGRAIFAVRDNELAAASFGINVTAYKLIAFIVSGAFAGLGGSLYAHQTTIVVSNSFSFQLALTFVLMVVVGGLGSRVGVFIGSAFFAIFPLALNKWSTYTPLIGAGLLLLTLTVYPGGVAQQLEPITSWLAGKPFSMHRKGATIQTGGAGVRP